MKNLILNLKRKIILLEFQETRKYYNAGLLDDYNTKEDRENWKFICIACDLTEELLSNTDLIEETKLFTSLGDRERRFKDYTEVNPGFQFRKESFISAIEAQGWHWGESPLKYVKTPAEEIADKNKWARFMSKEESKFLEAESRTFHPERVIIFEIVVGPEVITPRSTT